MKAFNLMCLVLFGFFGYLLIDAGLEWYYALGGSFLAYAVMAGCMDMVNSVWDSFSAKSSRQEQQQ